MSAADATDIHDYDLEATNLVFHDPKAVDRLPFRLTGHEIRFPLGHAVRKVIATPAAVSSDGSVRGEVVADLLLADGVPLTSADIRDLRAFPMAPFFDALGRRSAALVRRRSLLERKAELAQEQRGAPNDAGLVAEEKRLISELDAIRGFLADPSRSQAPATTKVSTAIITGTALRDLTTRDQLPPVYPGISPPGHFAIRVGPSFTGKTTFELYLAMARAAGVAPWVGAPMFKSGRTLIISPDEPVEQIARQIRRLAATHPGGRTFDYFAHIAVLGLDPTIPMGALDDLRFDDAGFALLDELLDRDGYSALTIDAYGDMLARGDSEQDNEVASRNGGALEALAVKHGIPITLIHHVGKLADKKTADVDVRDLGRGASALAAKARTVFTFEEVDGFSNHRRIRTRTNLTRSPAPLDLVVTEKNTLGTAIEFFRPVDPATAWPIAEVFTEVPSDWISTSELARRMTGHDEGKPTGPAMTRAAEVRGIWLGAGLIEVRDGPKKSKELRRIR